jgi:hypothetical protein
VLCDERVSEAHSVSAGIAKEEAMQKYIEFVKTLLAK